ncbi:glutathione synthetase [Plasmodium gaboni]|uniref:Glutathione synthetase n=1 Tax=Plasmodium gaboni TaxID=647221 RepID=A0ABY1UIJ9_9APIC|nr:glutathione synthetase [Plasmodium gaboni]
MERKVDDFYKVIQKEVLNYFTCSNGKNEYLSYERIKLLIKDMIAFLNAESYYIFTNVYRNEYNIDMLYTPRLFSFTLLPHRLDKKLLELCRCCTLLYSELFDNMVCDLSYLLGIFDNIKEHDFFLKKMLEVCKKVYVDNNSSCSINNCYRRNIKDDIRCVIGRSDYMTNRNNDIIDDKEKNDYENIDDKEKNDYENIDDKDIKQIEYNTISVAFGNLSSVLFKGHKYMLKQIYKEYFPYIENEEEQKEVNEILDKKFDNNFLEGIIKCFKKCHDMYISEYIPLLGSHKIIMLSILHEEDFNSFDKYRTINELNKININIKPLTINEIKLLFEKKKIFLNYKNETLTDSLIRIKNKEYNPYNEIYKPGKLLIDLNDIEDNINIINYILENINIYQHNIFEISVLYFRSLYTPDHFNEEIWKIREMFEFSDAIKIPSLPYQLVGSKKIQMLLLDDNILKKYISLNLNKEKKSDEQIMNDMNLLKKTFALQVDPSQNINEPIIQDAIKNENNYLLKPQREGGKNNLHGNQIKQKLMLFYDNNQKQTLSHYVLMQRLFPSCFTAIHCRTQEIKNETDTINISNEQQKKKPSHLTQFSLEKSISEFSLFHNFIFYKNRNILNEQKGYLVRTKNYSENEGGAICGISSLDSFFLTQH